MIKIPLSEPNLSGNEEKYLLECLRTNYVSSAGAFVGQFEKELANYLGVKWAVAVSCGTAALHVALLVSGVGRDDEVFVPNLTFIAPTNAVKYVGAHPIFVDSEWQTLGMDPDKIEAFLKEKATVTNGVCLNKLTGRPIRAIIPMHIFGTPVQMNRMLEIAQKYNLQIIEDASQSLGAKYQDKHTGTIGHFGCFSFNGNKIITTGGGGMLVTNDDLLAKRARHLSTTAKINNLEFLHDEVGYNYRMVNVLAAIGLAQFENLPKFLEIKKKNFNYYAQKIARIPGLKLYTPTGPIEPNYWFYPLILEKEFPLNKNELMSFLREKGIDSRPIWTPMEFCPMFGQDQKTDTTESRKIHEVIINIPCSTGLSFSQIDFVCQALEEASQLKKQK